MQVGSQQHHVQGHSNHQKNNNRQSSSQPISHQQMQSNQMLIMQQQQVAMQASDNAAGAGRKVVQQMDAQNRGAEAKTMNQSSSNQAANPSLKNPHAFSNSGSHSNLLNLGQTPPHKQQSTSFQQMKVAKNIRQISMNAGSSMQKQMPAQAKQGVRLGVSQGPANHDGGVGGQHHALVPKLQAQVHVPSQPQNGGYGRHASINPQSSSLHKQMIQQRAAQIGGDANQNGNGHHGIKGQGKDVGQQVHGGNMGSGNNGGALGLNGGKVFSRDQQNNYRNGGYVLTGNSINQYSLRGGLPQGQQPIFQSNTKPIQPHWQSQKKSNQFNQQLHSQSNSKSSIMPTFIESQHPQGIGFGAPSGTQNSSQLPMSNYSHVGSNGTQQAPSAAQKGHPNAGAGGANKHLYTNNKNGQLQQVVNGFGHQVGKINDLDTPLRKTEQAQQSAISIDPFFQASAGRVGAFSQEATPQMQQKGHGQMAVGPSHGSADSANRQMRASYNELQGPQGGMLKNGQAVFGDKVGERSQQETNLILAHMKGSPSKLASKGFTNSGSSMRVADASDASKGSYGQQRGVQSAIADSSYTNSKYAKALNNNPYSAAGPTSVMPIGAAASLGQAMPNQPHAIRHTFKNAQNPPQFLSTGKHNLRQLQENISEKKNLAAERNASNKGGAGAMNNAGASLSNNNSSSTSAFPMPQQSISGHAGQVSGHAKPGTYQFYFDENFQSSVGSAQSQGSQVGSLRVNTWQIQQISSTSQQLASQQMMQSAQQQMNHSAQQQQQQLGHVFMTPQPFYMKGNGQHSKLKTAALDAADLSSQQAPGPAKAHTSGSFGPHSASKAQGSHEYGGSVFVPVGPQVRVGGRGQALHHAMNLRQAPMPHQDLKNHQVKYGGPGSGQNGYANSAFNSSFGNSNNLIKSNGQQIMSFGNFTQSAQGSSSGHKQRSMSSQKRMQGSLQQQSAQAATSSPAQVVMAQVVVQAKDKSRANTASSGKVLDTQANGEHNHGRQVAASAAAAAKEARREDANSALPKSIHQDVDVGLPSDKIKNARRSGDGKPVASSRSSSARKPTKNEAALRQQREGQSNSKIALEQSAMSKPDGTVVQQQDSRMSKNQPHQRTPPPHKDKEEESKSVRRDQETQEDDLMIHIQDDEAEIGPVDDEVEEMGEDSDCARLYHVEEEETDAGTKEAGLQPGGINADLDHEQAGLPDGGYYDGDEPEDDDSQDAVDDQEDFDCADEEGEDDLLGAEEGEEEAEMPIKVSHQHSAKPDDSRTKTQEQEVDVHSKVSTACTNEEQTLIKIKHSSTADGKSKRKSTKSKKGAKARSKVYGEGLEGLDEEQRQRRLDLTILDNQLDQLVIEKPAALVNQPGKDRSLKDAFLRRPPNNVITLTYGPVPGRPPTIFFNYPPFLQLQRPFVPSRILKLSQEDMKPYSALTFKINNSTHTYNCVVNAFKIAGFRLSEGGAWNCLWTGLIRPSKLKYMNQYQKINHFAGAWNIGHKGNLWRNVQRQRRRHGRDFEICPPTYLFPEDYKRWCNEREVSNYREMYIMKPTGSSCGRGIRVIGRKQTVSKRPGYLVQKYLAKPHLLRGYKYDMRIYIVVTSFEPLKAYQFAEGLVRLATQPYSTAKGSLKKRFIHLTNFSINKKAENYKKNANTIKNGLGGPGAGGQSQQRQIETRADSSSTAQDTEEGEMSSKWSLEQLRQEYERMGVSYEEVFKQIKTLCIKTLMAVEPQITTAMRAAKHRNQCFEIYGFDVIIDAKLRPWLLEVNVAPSLSSSSPYDKQVKTMLLCDTLHLVGFQPFDRKKLEDEKKKENRHRLLGFEPTRHGGRGAHKQEDPDCQMPSSAQKGLQQQTPVKQKSLQSELNSPDKYERSAVKAGGMREKAVIPSFLDGFTQLTEDDMEILADFEEEQSRRGHFETIFPTREAVESLGGYFESQRHANSVLWQYIRQKQPIQHVRAYFKAHPYI